jgi:hypothetical protein
MATRALTVLKTVSKLTILGACVFAGFKIQRMAQAAEYIPPTAQPTFNDLVREIPKRYGIPKELVWVTLKKESGGKRSAIRFEPHHLKRYGYKITENTDEARMYASSHCQFQIMAWHLKFDDKGRPANFGEWSDLYQPEVCVRQFARIMTNCLNRHVDAPSRYDQIERAFECYNGSKDYARDAMAQLSRLTVGVL